MQTSIVGQEKATLQNVWQKDENLQNLKTELQTLERKIMLSLAEENKAQTPTEDVACDVTETLSAQPKITENDYPMLIPPNQSERYVPQGRQIRL